MACGDWHMESAVMQAAGWLDTVDGKIFAPDDVTYAGGKGRASISLSFRRAQHTQEG